MGKMWTRRGAEGIVALLLLAVLGAPAFGQTEVKNAPDTPSAQTAQAAQARSPRFLILVAEQNVETPMTAWWTLPGLPAAPVQPGVVASDLALAENEFADAFRLKGFEVVDRMAMTGKVEVAEPLRTPSPGNRQAAEIGGLFSADFVVVGRALATETGVVPGSGMISSNATLSVRVVAVKTGEIVAAGSQDAAAVHANRQAAGAQALRKAARLLAETLVKAINSRPGMKAFVFD